MRTIAGAITGIIVGFIASSLLAQKSGRETRQDIADSMDENLFKLQLEYHKLAVKMGIESSRKKIAELTKDRMEKDHGDKNIVDPTARADSDALKKVHERDQATKAVDNSTAKSQLRKVPTKE